jgi:hypothetical protein
MYFFFCKGQKEWKRDKFYKLICASFTNHYRCDGSGRLHATIHGKSSYLKTFESFNWCFCYLIWSQKFKILYMLKLHSKPSWWYITYKYGRQLLNTQYRYNHRKTPLSSVYKFPSVCKDLDCIGQSFDKCQTQHYWHSSIPEQININRLRHNTLTHSSSSILKKITDSNNYSPLFKLEPREKVGC